MTVSKEDLILNSQLFWDEIKLARKRIASSNTILVNSQDERNQYYDLSSYWFKNFSKVLSSYGVSANSVNKFDSAFKALLKLSSQASRRSSIRNQLEIIYVDFNNEIVIFLMTDANEPCEVNHQELGDEVLTLLEKIPDKEENKYLQEALGCWKSNYLKGATILLWCAGIDRIHKVIEQNGFELFNKSSAQMKNQSTGRFKRFTKQYNIQSISELRSTVFDNDLLWVLEGMQLIDANERTRLAGCFEMRCNSGHPGDAPITKYNVLSCFSDIIEIILANPKFFLNNLADEK